MSGLPAWLAQEFFMRQRKWQLVPQVKSNQDRPRRCSSWLHADITSQQTALYNVLCPRQGPLGGTTVLLTVQLGQLQDWHVAQGTHFPNLQPLNKAPVEQHAP